MNGNETKTVASRNIWGLGLSRFTGFSVRGLGFVRRRAYPAG